MTSCRPGASLRDRGLRSSALSSHPPWSTGHRRIIWRGATTPPCVGRESAHRGPGIIPHVTIHDPPSKVDPGVEPRCVHRPVHRTARTGGHDLCVAARICFHSFPSTTLCARSILVLSHDAFIGRYTALRGPGVTTYALQHLFIHFFPILR
jgi:hypothetical protein